MWMGMPWLLWMAYRYRTNLIVKRLFILLLAVSAALLLKSYARAPMLAAGFTATGFFLSVKISRTAFILGLFAGAVMIVVVATTTFTNIAYRDYFLKGVNIEQGQGLFYTRESAWAESYAAAEKGGWFGAGYGVSVGDEHFQGGLTAIDYGREKGNSQLAIVEETGIVGLVLHVIILLTIFTPLLRAHLRERDADVKVMLGIIIGTIAGFIAESVFEAWWVSPASVESVYIWGLAGAGLFIAHNSYRVATEWNSSRIFPQQALYPARAPTRRSVEG
jgi:O-antigen ligase